MSGLFSGNIFAWVHFAAWMFLAYLAFKSPKKNSKYLVIAFVLLGITSLFFSLLYFYIQSAGMSYQSVEQIGSTLSVLLFVATIYFFYLSLKADRALVDYSNQHSNEDINMQRAKGGVMRYLLSSAFLNGTGYRKNVIRFFNSEVRLFAPESGLDLPLLLNTCKKLESREVKYESAFIVLSVILVPTILNLASSRRTEEAAVLFALLFTFTAGGIWIFKNWQQKRWVNQLFIETDFTSEKFAKDFFGEHAKKTYSKESESNNVVIYNGFNPFIGSGIDVGGWSMSIDTSKENEDSGNNVENFTEEALYEYIGGAVIKLGFDNIEVKDLLFVNGSDLRDKDWLLPDEYGRPTGYLNAEEFEAFYKSSDKDFRHYKLIQVRDWAGDIVISTYVRVYLQHKNLFIEVSRFVLPPISFDFRKIDQLLDVGLLSKIRSGVFRLFLGGFLALWASLSIIGRGQRAIKRIFVSESKRERKMIRRNSLFNYGSKTSIRESYAGNEYVHYFQKLDKELYMKTLERELLDAIVVFLDDHNVNTSEIAERRTTIINSGILVKGGNVNAGAIAVGDGAKASANPKKGLFNKTANQKA